MDTDLMTNSVEENVLGMLPVWEEGTWNALQGRKFNVAADRFLSIISKFSPEARQNVYWAGLLSGIPAVRDELTEDEWHTSVLPFIARALVEYGTGRMVGEALGTVPLEERGNVYREFVSAIPGSNTEQKMQWLSDRRPSYLPVFTALPAQVLWSGPGYAMTQSGIARLLSLTRTLQDALFSYDVADAIRSVAASSLLPVVKVPDLARVAGGVLLGTVNLGAVEGGIRTTVGVNDKTLGELVKGLQTYVFSRFLPEIQEAFELAGAGHDESRPERGVVRLSSGAPEPARPIPVRPIVPLAARPPFVGKSSPSTPRESWVGAPPTGQAAPTGTSGPKTENQPKPLMLHEEGSSPSMPTGPSAFPQPKKHFSVLNFLKPKTPPLSGINVRARVEAPGSPAAPASKELPKRVVYYGDTPTPITPAGRPGSMVNLDTFRITQKPAQPVVPVQQPPAPGAPKPQAPIPSVSAPLQPPKSFAAPPAPMTQSQPFASAPLAPRPVTPPPPLSPKLDGNTIDLRNSKP